MGRVVRAERGRRGLWIGLNSGIEESARVTDAIYIGISHSNELGIEIRITPPLHAVRSKIAYKSSHLHSLTHKLPSVK